MKKPGRNDPCPCGSGKKYKKCCLNDPAMAGTFIYTDLDILSNKVPKLIGTGKLDEAEDICQTLMKQYPDQIDGLQRYAELLEARGDKHKAAEYYRKAAAFAQQTGGFAQETIDFFLQKAELPGD
ncbi:MAG: SEC-C domain-containing protein [Syntrophobacterales bacterium]|nr:SEC-C domain-containing protein [Syntrophobacterales bacterium]